MKTRSYECRLYSLHSIILCKGLGHPRIWGLLESIPPRTLRDNCTIKVIQFITHHNISQKHLLSALRDAILETLQTPNSSSSSSTWQGMQTFLLPPPYSLPLLIDLIPLHHHPPTLPTHPPFPHHRRSWTGAGKNSPFLEDCMGLGSQVRG